MKTPLTRLLRLRALLEESSRMELERSTAAASAISQARERERGNARVSRARAAEAIFQSSGQSNVASAAARLDDLARLREAEWRCAAMSAGDEQRIVPLARAADRRVAKEREGFMERRKDRRQVERVLESAVERAHLERERHEQRELDDWFGMKQSRHEQRRKQR